MTFMVMCFLQPLQKAFFVLGTFTWGTQQGAAHRGHQCAAAVAADPGRLLLPGRADAARVVLVKATDTAPDAAAAAALCCLLAAMGRGPTRRLLAHHLDELLLKTPNKGRVKEGGPAHSCGLSCASTSKPQHSGFDKFT